MSPRGEYLSLMTVNAAGVALLFILGIFTKWGWPFLLFVVWFLVLGQIAGWVRCPVCSRPMGKIVNAKIGRMLDPPPNCDRCGFDLEELDPSRIQEARQVWEERP